MFGNFTVRILSFLVVPLYIHKLTISLYGIYAFIQALFSYFALFQIGVGPAVTKYVAQFYAEKNYDRINHIITFSLLLQFCISLIIAVIMIIFNQTIFSDILHLDSSNLKTSKAAIKIACINFVFMFTVEVLFCVFRGFQRYDYLSKILILRGFLNPVIAVIFLSFGFGISGMFAGYSIVSVIVLIVALCTLKNKYSWLSFSFKTPIKKTITLLYDFGFYIFVARLSRLGVTALPVFLLGNFFGSAHVGYYQICFKILDACQQVPVNIMRIMFPLTSEISVEKGIESIKSIYLKGNKYGSLMITPVFAFISIFSYPILTFWLGRCVAMEVSTMLSILACGFLLANITIVPVNIVMGLGKTHSLAVNGALRITVVLISLPLFLKNFGFKGVGYNLILSEIVSMFWILYVNKKILDLKNRQVQFWINDRLYHILITVPTLFLLSLLNTIFFKTYITEKLHMFIYLIVCFAVFMYIFIQTVISFKIIDKKYQEFLFSRFKWSGMLFFR